jgi:hypothetical protein
MQRPLRQQIERIETRLARSGPPPACRAWAAPRSFDRRISARPREQGTEPVFSKEHHHPADAHPGTDHRLQPSGRQDGRGVLGLIRRRPSMTTASSSAFCGNARSNSARHAAREGRREELIGVGVDPDVPRCQQSDHGHAGKNRRAISRRQESLPAARARHIEPAWRGPDRKTKITSVSRETTPYEQNSISAQWARLMVRCSALKCGKNYFI